MSLARTDERTLLLLLRRADTALHIATFGSVYGSIKAFLRTPTRTVRPSAVGTEEEEIYPRFMSDKLKNVRRATEYTASRLLQQFDFLGIIVGETRTHPSERRRRRVLFLDAYISPLEKEIPFQSQAGCYLGGPTTPHPFFPLPPSTISVCPSPSFFAFIHHHGAAAAVTHSVIKTSLLRRRSPIFHASDESMPLSPPLFVSSPFKKLSAWQSDWGPRRVSVFFFLPTRFLCQGGLIFFFFF